jgi:hypothetical protein
MMPKQPPTPAIRKTQSRVNTGKDEDPFKSFIKDLGVFVACLFKPTEKLFAIQQPPIGQTRTSIVYRAMYNEKAVALKCLKPGTRQTLESKNKEYEYGHKLKHPHLVWYQKRYPDPSNGYLIAFLVCLLFSFLIPIDRDL